MSQHNEFEYDVLKHVWGVFLNWLTILLFLIEQTVSVWIDLSIYHDLF